MARHTEAVCRFCRREGLKLFLKGERCYTDKCAFERRGYPPGQHGQGRGKFSDYGNQLREKQKVKRIYSIQEKQFQIYFQNALSKKGITGENLLALLESRLDNVVYRLGFANSRSEARQLVRHRHFLVNGKPVTIPSFRVKVSDTIQLREKSRNTQSIKDALEALDRRGVPKWLELDKDQFAGRVRAPVARDDVSRDINENLIVAFYTR
ncbi:MAG: 30S ribosomal protein S4 [bacterium]